MESRQREQRRGADAKDVPVMNAARVTGLDQEIKIAANVGDRHAMVGSFRRENIVLFGDFGVCSQNQ